MQILGLFGMYFDALVVFVMKNSLLFRLALCSISGSISLHVKLVPLPNLKPL